MKRTILASTVGGTVIVLAASCSQQGLQSGSDDGASGMSGSTASGGAAPMGGATTGGAAPTGGATTGGAAPTGGATTGGAAPTGGATTGGAAPTGGATTGGAMTGGAAPTGGTDAGGLGGTTATGGTDTGGTTSGGMSGTSGVGPTGGTGGTGTGTLDPRVIVPTFDGYMWIGTCSSGGAGLDCTLNNDQNQCPNNTTSTPFAMRGAIREVRHTVGGTMNQKYILNFEVRGVAGGKFYQGGMQAATSGFSEGPEGNNSWYVGGTPTDSKWNTYEIHVEPPVPGEANTYYLNGFPVSTGFDGRHETLVIRYTASFAVLGGGTIRLVLHDSNCLGQQNCGQTVEGQAMCSAPRTVDLTGMTPQPPTTFMQPYAQSGGFHPQWLFFDVKTVTAG